MKMEGDKDEVAEVGQIFCLWWDYPIRKENGASH